ECKLHSTGIFVYFVHYSILRIFIQLLRSLLHKL
ncbi:hypothetical protein H8958_011117, partial [Nasalis larvatus]